jgi:hypothetical protein
VCQVELNIGPSGTKCVAKSTSMLDWKGLECSVNENVVVQLLFFTVSFCIIFVLSFIPEGRFVGLVIYPLMFPQRYIIL